MEKVVSYTGKGCPGNGGCPGKDWMWHWGQGEGLDSILEGFANLGDSGIL